jgi:hypothetical protein
MPLDPTPARLKRCHACDQWRSSRKFTFLTSSHCELRPNTEGTTRWLRETTVFLNTNFGRRFLGWRRMDLPLQNQRSLVVVALIIPSRSELRASRRRLPFLLVWGFSLHTFARTHIHHAHHTHTRAHTHTYTRPHAPRTWMRFSCFRKRTGVFGRKGSNNKYMILKSRD